MCNRVQEIFEAAMEVPERERSAFIAGACAGDSALRREVGALIESHAQAGQFLRQPTMPVNEASAPTIIPADSQRSVADDAPLSWEQGEPPDVKLGTMIDRYRLVRELGSGGFGVVFLAEQTDPVVRSVALKIIRAGWNTEQIIARFEIERQALALMDHPSIARVFDAGATARGLPYFVMELVDGEPITRYCDSRKLSLVERIKLFRKVCGAVQHAHQKGIIHRDLKPSNVLVTLADGEPLPKVIDFGIAKATKSTGALQEGFTRAHQVIGTPEYMSPEQAENLDGDIDTRSDVYSLGVMLYELLTGQLPFDADRLRDARIHELRHIICDEEPLKPSTRVTGESGVKAAQCRGTGASRLSVLLRGDLDWIVMKCLEKDRSRRYETAQALADDLQRCLTNEPVVAGPPSAAYKLQKFVRRNRVEVAAAGIVLAALLLGVVGTTSMLFRAKHAETVARQGQRAADQIAATVGDGFSMLLFTAAKSPEGSLSREQGIHRLKEIADWVESGSLAQAPDAEIALRIRIRAGFELFGNLDAGDEVFDPSRHLLPGAPAERARAFEVVARTLRDHADLLDWFGYPARAEGLLRRCDAQLAGIADATPNLRLTIKVMLGEMLSNQSKPKEAIAILEEAIREIRALERPDRRLLALALHDLGSVHLVHADRSRVEALLVEALELRRAEAADAVPPGVDADVAQSVEVLARFYARTQSREPDYIESLMVESLKIRRELATDARGRARLAKTLSFLAHDQLNRVIAATALGDIAMRNDASEAADTYAQEAVRLIQTAIPDANLTTVSALQSCVGCYIQRPDYRAASDLNGAILDLFQKHEEWNVQQSRSVRNTQINLLRKQGRLKEALGVCRELVEYDRKRCPEALTNTVDPRSIFLPSLKVLEELETLVMSESNGNG